MKKILLMLLICVPVLFLSGCFVVGGAAVGAGGAVAYDQRPLKTQIKDDDIDENLYLKIEKNKELSDNSHINFTTYRGKMLLAGQAKNAEVRDKIIAIAKQLDGIKIIVNHITIAEPLSFSARSQDTWITTKVKSKFLTASGLKSGEFKVLTEDNTVYLLGFATHSQTDLAISVAQSVKGVQKVVNLVEYER